MPQHKATKWNRVETPLYPLYPHPSLPKNPKAKPKLSQRVPGPSGGLDAAAAVLIAQGFNA